ncbi:MAG: hypothetical protein C0622_03205 [Desulfuromonas sp.]|nr:MAG: hypothetical protein C0622_03205 [Desulfuromonas sp.]
MLSGSGFTNGSELVLWYLSFIVAITAHEAAHAWAALKLGDPTAFEGGQVSLDPTPHIRRSPFGTVVVPLLSYLSAGWMIGWASTPYNRNWADRNPKSAAMMALAGPLANLALVLISALVIRIGMLTGHFHAPAKISFTSVVAADSGGVPEGLAVLLSICFTLNLILLVFNLIPLPPLDGSGIIPLLLDGNTARKYNAFIQRSAMSLIGLFIAWNFFGQLFRPIHTLALNLLYPGAHYH